MIGTSLLYKDCYLIYIDRLGTKFLINEADKIYENRIGFYEMSPLYSDTYEIFKEIFDNEFKFFGFSDTVIAVPSINDLEKIYKSASKAFVRLLGYSIANRIYITYGDFAFHRFEDITIDNDNFICPIYGTTVLNAHEMDEKKIECLGIFVHNSVPDKSNVINNAKFNDKDIGGLIDIEKYLSEEERKDLKSFIEEKIKVEEVEKSIDDYLQSGHGTISTQMFENMEIPNKERIEILGDVFKRKKLNNQATLSYYRNLKSAIIEKNEIIIKINNSV